MIKCLLRKNITLKPQKKGGRTVHLTIELRELQRPHRNYTDLSPVEINQGITLSICGNIRGCGSGQIVETFEKYIPFFGQKNKEIAKNLAFIWHNYHLNDLQAGTKLQQDTLEENRDKWHMDSGDNYSREKEFLENRNLLIDNGYKYGTDWLYKSVPEDIIEFVESL